MLGWSYLTSHLCFQGPSSNRAKAFSSHLYRILSARLNLLQHCPMRFCMVKCSPERVPESRSPCPPSGFISMHFSLALRDEQDVDKSATPVTGKPGFRACANKHLFISIRGGKAALDKKGVKEPCKYTILGPLDLCNGAGK